MEEHVGHGQYASVNEIAIAEKIDRGHVGSILRLTLLAPDIIEAILDGRRNRSPSGPKRTLRNND
jgi:hypothetical protein